MFKRLIALFVIVSFIFSYYQPVYVQGFSVNELPVPGTMVGESLPFTPLTLKGLVINLQKPLEFQFIVDTGHGPQDTATIKDQANQLVKYFLAGLTIPEGDLWVNLSPYEKNRMVPEALGQTDLGRDLLAQDYILKQLTASLIYPEKYLGKEFWSRVYAKAQEQFGTTDVPVNTFNKVWILPDQAQVFEQGAAAYVTKATLKVMLDEDYLALQKHMAVRNGTDSIGANIVREIVIPEITKEVNTGKNFAPLRQIYQALILAKWYKETIQNGLLDAVYTNKNKVAGVNLNDPAIKEQIYERYLKAYKKGAFNYIKEDPTPEGQVVPRKYFSGGTKFFGYTLDITRSSNAMLSLKKWAGVLLLLTVTLGSPALAQNERKSGVSSQLTYLLDKEWPSSKRFPGKKLEVKIPPIRMLEQSKPFSRQGPWQFGGNPLDTSFTVKWPPPARLSTSNGEDAAMNGNEGHRYNTPENIEFMTRALLRAYHSGENSETVEMEARIIARIGTGIEEYLNLSGASIFQDSNREEINSMVEGYLSALDRDNLILEKTVRKMDLDQKNACLKAVLALGILNALILTSGDGADDIESKMTTSLVVGADGSFIITDQRMVHGVELEHNKTYHLNKEELAGMRELIRQAVIKQENYVNAVYSRLPLASPISNVVFELQQILRDTDAIDLSKLIRKYNLTTGPESEQELLALLIQPGQGAGIKSNPLPVKSENGGIDLNQINVNRTGKTINVQFDPAQLNELEQSNFKGFTPVITGFKYIQSPFPLLGVNPVKEPEILAKA